MATTFLLKDKHRETSYIQIVVRFRGQMYKKSTGETIPVKYWNQGKKRCNVPLGFKEGNYVNDVLDKWDIAAKKTVANFKTKFNLPTPEEFWGYFDSVYYDDAGSAGGKEDDNLYFVGFFEEYIQRTVRSSKAESTVKKYVTTLHKLRDFEKEKRVRLRFEDVNIDFYRSFQRWAYSKELAANTFGSHIKNIKKVIREANYEGLCDNIKGIQHREFITVNQDSDSIYLTTDELEAIFKLDITAEALKSKFEEMEDSSQESLRRKVESLKLVRERFLIGAFTGLRVSDFSRLEELNFGQTTIRIKTHKTGASVVIPIHPYIRSILEGGFDPAVKMSDQKMNKQLKYLARLAGIKQKVLINENIGGKDVAKSYAKWELVCTHTARRSFATNAFKAGVPTLSIMKITGHTKESTFLKYIKVSAEENAEILADHPFFK